MSGPLTFQETILRLEAFWAARGCVIQQPYDIEVGAGTMNPATFLRALGPEPWRVAYVEPSRRPTDGRYGENPNRLQHYYQYQVILKPSPENVQDMYLDSLKDLGINPLDHDIRFVEDDWESPGLGAWGLGWEVWLDGMEITQFTYFPAGGRAGFGPHLGRAHLRPRADRDVPPGGGERIRPRLVPRPGNGRGGEIRRRAPPDRGGVQPLQLRRGGPGHPLRALRHARGRGASAHREGPDLSRLRSGPQVLPRLQRARRAGGHQRGRAGALHRAHPQDVPRLRRGVSEIALRGGFSAHPGQKRNGSVAHAAYAPRFAPESKESAPARRAS